MIKSLIITIILTISLMNCKKVVDTKEININKKWQGDTLITDAKFINSINST